MLVAKIPLFDVDKATFYWYLQWYNLNLRP